MVNNEGINKDSDSRKILGMIVLIATLMICTTSATYAYFAIAPVSNNVVTGTAASAGLTLTVQKSLPTTDPGPLVPQLSSALATAMNSTNNCVDGNGNTVCLVYTVTVNNTSSSAVKVDGTITFSGSTNMPNLKWYKATNVNTLGATLYDKPDDDNVDTTDDGDIGTAANVTTAQTLVSEQPLAAQSNSTTDDTAVYYVVVWIREIGAVQSDNGTFRANIEFTSSNGTGITSTITG